MKLSELQTIDQNIIKFLAEHRGIDRAVKGKILAQDLILILERFKVELSTSTSKVAPLVRLITAILFQLTKTSAGLALSRNNAQA